MLRQLSCRLFIDISMSHLESYIAPCKPDLYYMASKLRAFKSKECNSVNASLKNQDAKRV